MNITNKNSSECHFIGCHSSAGETFPLVVNAFAGADEFNTFRIKPAFGVTSSITGSSSTAIIKLNGADYVTIDGSNDGSQNQSLTITNTSTAANTAVIWIGGNTGNGALYNSIRNCKTNCHQFPDA